jgi:hypothetical protein
MRDAVVLALLGVAAAAWPARAAQFAATGRSDGTATVKILSVVEQTVADDKLVARVRQKLSTLDGRTVALLARLADRVATGGRTAGTDVARLLLAALIVFE